MQEMNLQWDLAKLRYSITCAKERGETTEALESCLLLGESIARSNRPAISHIEKTQPPESE